MDYMSKNTSLIARELMTQISKTTSHKQIIFRIIGYLYRILMYINSCYT